MPPQEMTERQAAIDATAKEWPEVRAKGVFGHLGYVRGGKMFGFMADEGLAVKVWAGEESDSLYAREGVRAFRYNNMDMRAWPVLPVRSDEDVDFALTELRRAYERATAT